MFGIYLSLIGMTIICVTLFSIGILSDVMRKILIRMVQSTENKSKKRVAAVSAVFYLDHFSPEEFRFSEGRKIWIDVARKEAVKMEGL